MVILDLPFSVSNGVIPKKSASTRNLSFRFRFLTLSDCVKTKLITNGAVSLESEHLSVRPERRRRAPQEFSHSLRWE